MPRAGLSGSPCRPLALACCACGLLALAAAAGGRVLHCGPASDTGQPVKPSSLAPRTRAHGRAYGAPLQPPILHKAARHKRAKPAVPPAASP